METFNQLWDIAYKLVSGSLSLGILLILAGIFRKIGGWEQWRLGVDKQLSRIEFLNETRERKHER